MIEFSWSGNKLKLNEVEILLPAPIVSAMEIGDLLVVAMDSDQPALMKQRFANVRAYKSNGVVEWEVELPSSHPADSYWQVDLGDPISAKSFSSYKCQIDPRTGKVTAADFYK